MWLDWALLRLLPPAVDLPVLATTQEPTTTSSFWPHTPEKGMEITTGHVLLTMLHWKMVEAWGREDSGRGCFPPKSDASAHLMVEPTMNTAKAVFTLWRKTRQGNWIKLTHGTVPLSIFILSSIFVKKCLYSFLFPPIPIFFCTLY